MNCTRPLSPSLSPWVCSKWCPLSQWCQLTILSSVIPFLFCAQSFPASGSFPVTLHIRWPKYWSFSFSISPSNEYSGLISFRLTGLISLLSKGLSRVFSNITVWRHQFFGIQPSLWTNSHIHCTGDAIQPSHPLSSSSLPAFNFSHHQGLFKGVSSLHQVAKVSASASVLPINIQDDFL